MATLNVIYRIGANITDLQRGVDQASGTLDRMSRNATRAGVAMLPLSAAVAGFGIASFKAGKDFERTMTQVANITDLGADRIDELTDRLLEMAPAVGIGPQQLGEALLVVASTGLNAESSLAVLETSAKAAAVGLGDTKDVARAITSAMVAYGESNLTASDAANQLFVAVRAGGAEANEFAGTLGRVVGVASELGISFSQVLASVAAFTRLGVDADEAVTALRGTMSVLLKPSKEATDQLLALGTSVDQVRQAVKEDGLANALIELVDLTKGNDDAIAAIIPNVRALAGVLGTAGAQADEYAQILLDVESATDDIDVAFERASGTIDMRWNKVLINAERILVNTFTVFKSEIIGVLGTLEPLVERTESWVDSLGTANDMTRKVVASVGGFVAVLGPLLIGLGSLGRLVSFVGGGLTTLLGLLGKINPVLALFVTGLASAPATLKRYELNIRAAGEALGLWNVELPQVAAGLEEVNEPLLTLAVRTGSTVPGIENLAEALGEVEESAETAGTSVVALTRSAEGWIPAGQLMNLTAEDTARSAAAAAVGLEAWAAASGRLRQATVLTSRPLQGLVITTTDLFRAQMAASGSSVEIVGNLGRVGDAAGKATGLLSGLTGGFNAFMEGLTGGKGFGGFMEKIGSGFVDQIGRMLTGGITSLINMGIGAIGKAIASIGRSTEDNLRIVGENMGLTLSDSLIDTLKRQVDSGAFDNVWSAVMGNLGKVFADMGGVAEIGIGKAIKMTRDLFSFVDMDLLTLTQAGESFDSVFRELIPEAVDFATGEIREDFIELIELAQQFGLESQELAAFMEDVGSRLDAALTTRAKILNDVLLEGVDAMKRFQDSGLAAGVDVPEAFRSMLEAARLLEGELTGPLIRGALAAGEALKSLDTLGQVSQHNFSQFGRAIRTAFDELVRGGASGAGALEALRPALATLIHLQDTYGFSVDATTQALIDEARQHGITGAEAVTAADRQLEATNRLIAVLERLMLLLQDDLPRVIENVPKIDIDFEVGELPDFWEVIPDNVTSRISFDYPRWEDIARDMGIPGFQHGGIMPRTGLAFLHAGERVTPAGGQSLNGRDAEGIESRLDTLTDQFRLLPEVLAMSLRGVLRQGL